MSSHQGQPSSFAERFDATIRERGLTNRQVAIELDVTERTVYRWRTEEWDLRLSQYRRIMEWMGAQAPTLPEAA